MKSYNATPLTDGDDITVKTYYKNICVCRPFPRLQNVEVSSIVNIGSGTVTARIGSTDSFAEMDKTQLYQYINLMGYSNTA